MAFTQKAQQPGFLCRSISLTTVADSPWWHESADDMQSLKLWSPSNGKVSTDDICSVSRAGDECCGDCQQIMAR